MIFATTLRYVSMNPGPWQDRFYIMKDYLDMARELGIGLISVLSANECERIADLCDGLIVPGSGTNIDPTYYGGEPFDPQVPVDEFALDRLLIDAFVKRGKPVFGICGGLQAINVYFGGTLKELDDAVAHRREELKTHEVNIAEGSFVYDVFGTERALVNCYHNWEIDRVGEGLTVVARTDDGVIEAIESKALHVYATQWHPEQSYHTGNSIEHKFFENFIKIAKECKV